MCKEKCTKGKNEKATRAKPNIEEIVGHERKEKQAIKEADQINGKRLGYVRKKYRKPH